ncbi:MAG: hypothetical protein JXQ89_20425 [Pelagimonas sp.]|jgi:hypothetical protein
MNQTVVLTFIAIFAIGPALCAVLMRLPARKNALMALAMMVVAATFAALWLNGVSPLATLSALWMGWICGVAMFALALCRRFYHPQTQRGITIMALMATTLPWFGLATALTLT